MPQPRPLPPGVTGCIGCNEPVWLSEPVHMLVGIPMLILLPAILVKLVWVLMGNLPNHGIYRTAVPVLWLVFFLSASFYLGRAVSDKLPVIPYDFTSLIPYGFFAVVDFIFAAKMRKAKQPPVQRDRKLSPWFEMP